MVIHTRKIFIEPRPARDVRDKMNLNKKDLEYITWRGSCRSMLVRAFKDVDINPHSDIRLSAQFMCKKKRGKKPDLINLLKALQDSLQDLEQGREKKLITHGIIHNDRQIVEYGNISRQLPKGQKCKTNIPYIIVSIEEI